MTEWNKPKKSTDFPDAPEPVFPASVATATETHAPPPPAPVVTGRQSNRFVPPPSPFVAKPETLVPPPAPVVPEATLPHSESAPESSEELTQETASPEPVDAGAPTPQEFKIEPVSQAPEDIMPAPATIVPEPLAAEPAREMNSDAALSDAYLSTQGSTAILDLFDFQIAETPSVAPPEPTAPATVPEVIQPVDTPLPKQGARSGRAARLGLCLPILIRGTRTTLREEAQTVFVLARGAVISLAAPVQVGDKLILINLKTGKESECRVLAVQRSDGGKNQVDVEFTQPQPKFWPVRFPPEDWNADERKRPAKDPISTTPLPETSKLTKSPAQSVAVPDSKPEPVVSAPVAQSTPAPPKPVLNTASEELRTPPAKRERPPIQCSDRVPLNDTLGLRSDQPATIKRPANENQNRGKLVLASTSVLLLVATLVAARMILRRPADTAQVIASVPTPATAQPPLRSAVEPRASATSTQLIAVNAESPAGAHPAFRASRVPDPQRPTKELADSSHPPADVSEPVTPTSKPQGVLGKLTTFVMPHQKAAAPAEGSEPPPNITAEVSGAVPGSQPDAVSGITSGLTPAAPAPKNSAPAPVGGQVKEPRLLSSVKPVYPQLARNTRAEGDVVIQTTIDQTGKVTHMKVISGPPVLQQAALDAVREWKYEPARLDGQPVTLQMLVTVRFRLK